MIPKDTKEEFGVMVDITGLQSNRQESIESKLPISDGIRQFVSFRFMGWAVQFHDQTKGGKIEVRNKDSFRKDEDVLRPPSNFPMERLVEEVFRCPFIWIFPYHRTAHGVSGRLVSPCTRGIRRKTDEGGIPYVCCAFQVCRLRHNHHSQHIGTLRRISAGASGMGETIFS